MHLQLPILFLKSFIKANENADNLSKIQSYDANWKDIDHELICMDCLGNKNDKNMPSKYKSTLSGHQGIINLKQSKHHLKSIMESHTSSGVHQWCHDTA